VVATIALACVIVSAWLVQASMFTPALASVAAPAPVASVAPSSDVVIDALFGVGTVLAALFIVVYVFKMGEYMPGNTKRYDRR
jgi:hypothetical protein